MSVPSRKTVFVVDAMAFRRARVESFLSPWAENEKVELISLDPDEAHARLVERNECDMLIYSVGTPSAHEIFGEIQVLQTLRRQAALAIVSDDENPATVIAAMRSGAQGYFGNSMPPELALQALSFVLHGGTYFSPTAIMASHALGGGLSTESRQHRLFQEQPLPGAERHIRRRPLGRTTALTNGKPPPFSMARRPASGSAMEPTAFGLLPSLPSGNTPFSPAFVSATPTR